jgi:hypothetical protein
MHWTKTYTGRYSTASESFRYVVIRDDLRKAWTLSIFDLSEDLRAAPIQIDTLDKLSEAKAVSEAYEADALAEYTYMNRYTRAIQVAFAD